MENNCKTSKSETFKDIIDGVHYAITKYAHPFKLIIENVKARYECSIESSDFITNEHIYDSITIGNIFRGTCRFHTKVQVTIANTTTEHIKYFDEIYTKKETRLVSCLDFTNITPIVYKLPFYEKSRVCHDNCSERHRIIPIDSPKIRASWLRFQFDRIGHSSLHKYKITLYSGDKHHIISRDFTSPKNTHNIWLPQSNDIRLEIENARSCFHNFGGTFNVEFYVDAIIE
jgi:hypothetical protein